MPQDLLPTPPLDAGDRAALAALLTLACEAASASDGWWEAVDGSRLLSGEAAPGADAAAVERHDAAIDGQCLARLALCAPRTAAAALRPLLCAAAALLLARAQAVQAQFEAERLRDAGRVASDWLWETDADSRVVWMTEGISALTGRNVRDELGMRTMEVNRPRADEYAASYQQYLADRAARRPVRNLVLDRDTPGGTITVSISGEPRFDADGRFLGYRGATRDITAEVKAREEARRALTLLQQALEGVPAGVAISDPDGRIRMANQRWRNGIGRDLPPGCDHFADVIRHHAAMGHYPDAIGREEAYVAWRLSLASFTPKAVELRWCDEWAMSADQRLPDGGTVHLSIFVTDRKRAELALSRTEDRWRFALEGAAHGVWDWERGQGMFFSPSWKAMLGYGEHEIASTRREWAQRLHPADRRSVVAELRQHARGETPIYETEYRLRHRDGHYLWIHDRGRAIRRAARGAPLRMVGTQSDITRLRLADQALRDKQAAELVSRSMSEFLSRMSHEMRTPLNAVIGFADLLRASGEFRADHVDHILAAGRHLAEVIDDVLDLQQVAHGRLTLRIDDVGVQALVRAVDAMLHPLAVQAAIACELRGLDGVAVRADAQRLRQVLLNLGSNAIKYNRFGGAVHWSVDRSDPARWGIVVDDTGPGLDAQQLARLFQPFERLGRETGPIQGSGLGLLIARRLVEAMDGELHIDSQAGRGTRATVWLPRAMSARAGARPVEPQALPARLPAEAAGSPRRILYVEDNPINALLFTEALRSEGGLSLRVAGDGDEALAIVRDWRPDMLVLDMQLPGANGTEVLRQLRLIDGLHATPAVVCSADAMPGDRERALAAGFLDYWTKPLDLGRLAADIEAVLDRPAAPHPT